MYISPVFPLVGRADILLQAAGLSRLAQTWLALIALSAILAGVTLWLAVRRLPITPTVSQLAIIGLASVTSAMHIYLGLSGDQILVVNGVGYYALLLALFWPIELTQPLRTPLSWGLVGYTLVTIVGYFVVHWEAFPTFDAIGLVNKAVEAVLLLLLVSAMARRRYIGIRYDVDGDLGKVKDTA